MRDYLVPNHGCAERWQWLCRALIEQNQSMEDEEKVLGALIQLPKVHSSPPRHLSGDKK